MTKEVAFEAVGRPINDRIDEAYRKKYGDSPYLGSMIGASARSATVNVTARDTAAGSRRRGRNVLVVPG
jgi:hypothetical protein